MTCDVLNIFHTTCQWKIYQSNISVECPITVLTRHTKVFGAHRISTIRYREKERNEGGGEETWPKMREDFK